MSYFLRVDKKKNGLYLQMYDRYWDKDLKQARTKNVKAFGYVDDLKSKEIKDPIAYYQKIVDEENKKREELINEQTRPRAFKEQLERNVGYFLLSSLLAELNVKEDIDILASVKNYQFSIYDMLSELIYARVIYPCSKLKSVSEVFPKLYNYIPISEDQIYDGLYFVGENYKKYIELFNHQYAKFYQRDFSTVFFDCTNYYFEVDLPEDDKQKGPSKENRTDPIIGQALLLDKELIPLAMEMYPGNESEIPHIRKIIEEMKSRYKVSGKTIQVADKGLNCARNVYAAVKEANDGYIFTKAIHGKGLSNKEKLWVTLENDANVFKDYKDSNGTLLYRLKECIDVFDYSFEEIDEEGNKTVTNFKVKEKRVVSYNPHLAVKQKAEINKEIEKASNFKTYKNLTKADFGDAAKYLDIVSKDEKGKNIKPIIKMNKTKIDEDLRLAGYNLIVTSELNLSPQEIYSIYHNLWKIEECFRITKSYLDARPVYVQKKETIYGHFLICYLALFLLRVLEIKCFNYEVNAYDIIEFIRDFRVVKKDDNTYINISSNQKVNNKIKEVTAKTNLDALYLSKDEIDKLFTNTMLIQ